MDKSDILRSLDWFAKIKSYLEPFKPETRHFSLNYSDRTCEIRLYIKAPYGVRRSHHKIEFPIIQGFKVKEFVDDTFNTLDLPFEKEDGKWKLDATRLPACENYLITLEGKIDPEQIARIVRVQPARNRDQTEEQDRYWLDSRIRDVEQLERIWHYLEVDNVDVDVRVAVDRCFSALIPEDLRRKIEVSNELLQVGKGMDRNQFMRAWDKYRDALRTPGVMPADILNIATKALRPEAMEDYFKVDNPYEIGKIHTEDSIKNNFPDSVLVNALTRLNYKVPEATGYLYFLRKDYVDYLKSYFPKIF